MDYPIELITAIEERGRAARLRGLRPSTCPYSDGSAHWHSWQVGYMAELLAGINAALSSEANEVVA